MNNRSTIMANAHRRVRKQHTAYMHKRYTSGPWDYRDTLKAQIKAAWKAEHQRRLEEEIVEIQSFEDWI